MVKHEKQRDLSEQKILHPKFSTVKFGTSTKCALNGAFFGDNQSN